MKGDAKVIEYLNRGLRSELTAINQYMLHSRKLEHWGLNGLAQKEMQEATEEMGHADRFIRRILFLEGEPGMQELDPLRIGNDVRSVLENDFAAEKEALALYREAAGVCEKARDYASRDLFTALLADEEGHYDYLDTQLGLIDSMGIENYRQSWTDAPAGE
ncbi:MAG: bacterioferritin [Halofilum sp. (in: g-proteobacteria)]